MSNDLFLRLWAQEQKQKRNAHRAKIIALNTERHNHLQEEEDFEAYYSENILKLLDDVVLQVASERASETSTKTAPRQKAPVSTTMRDFFAHFDAAYHSLMEAIFPGLALQPPSLARPVRAVRGGMHSGAEQPGSAGAVAPPEPAHKSPLTPEEARTRLPSWVVVPYVNEPKRTPEFAILWAGEGDAPSLPSLELRLDGQPRDENVFWPEVRTNVADLPPGKVTFVKFNRLRPVAFATKESEDGGLVVDFRT